MSSTPFKMKGISPLKHPHWKKKVRKSHTHKKKKTTKSKKQHMTPIDTSTGLRKTYKTLYSIGADTPY